MYCGKEGNKVIIFHYNFSFPIPCHFPQVIKTVLRTSKHVLILFSIIFFIYRKFILFSFKTVDLDNHVTVNKPGSLMLNIIHDLFLSVISVAEEFKSYAKKKPEYAKIFTTYQELKAQELQVSLNNDKLDDDDDQAAEFEQWGSRPQGNGSAKKLQ